jgi:8-oxo-dGTP diphosphatase
VAGLIRAAGGVVWRRAEGGEVEVLLVHRPLYDYWTIPKGKSERCEDDLACAQREVEEETGLRCAPGVELAGTRYVDGRGRDKVVRYWAMQPAGGSGLLLHEVDEAVWLPLAQAAARLSYPRDLPVLESLQAALR